MGQGTLGMSTTGSAAVIAIDDDTYSVAMIGTEHHQIHEDTAFSYSFSNSAATTASGAMGFITGISSTAGTFFVNLYEANTASGLSGSGGWTQSAYSARRNRNGTATGNIRWMGCSGNLINTSATLLDTHMIAGGTGVGGTKSGGTTGADEEFELKPSTVYALHYINSASFTSIFNIRAFHYDLD